MLRGEIDCPRSEIKELAEKNQSSKAMNLTQEDLEHDRELIWCFLRHGTL
jgi:hypothetical protein